MKAIITLSAAALFLFAGCQENIDERIAREAQEYTRRNCPHRMDNITLDSMTYNAATRTITYYNTMDSTLDTKLIKENKEKMYEAVGKSIKEDLNTKYYKENEVNFRYLYHNYDGSEIILDLKYTPKDYK